MDPINVNKGDTGVDRSSTTVSNSRTSARSRDDHSTHVHNESKTQNFTHSVDQSNHGTITTAARDNINVTNIHPHGGGASSSQWSMAVVAVVAILTVVGGMLYLSRGSVASPAVGVPAASAPAGSTSTVPASPEPSRPAAPSPGPTTDSVAQPPSPTSPAPILRAKEAPAVHTPTEGPLVNHANFNSTAPAVLMWGQNGASETLTQQIAAAVKGNDSLFLPAFVTSGRFARARQGDGSALTDLGLASAASLIVLGTRTVAVTPQEVAGEKMMKADAAASIRVYHPRDGFRSESFTERAIGAGFSAPDAERAADEALAKQVAARLGAMR